MKWHCGTLKTFVFSNNICL